MAWFEVYFARVYRVLGQRQRRHVVDAGLCIEAIYAAFWAEAALLVGDGAGLSAGGLDTTRAPPAMPATPPPQPAGAISSLLVLPSTAEPEDFRKLKQSLALALALLGLAQTFTLSGFHPRDTFEVITDDATGARSWEATLPHPMLHLVLKRPPTAS